MFRRFNRARGLAAALALAAAVVVPAAAVAPTATAVPGTATPAATAASSTCSGTGTIAAGDYMIQANEWNSSAQQCITYTGGTAWSVSTANFNLSTSGAPATYPSILWMVQGIGGIFGALPRTERAR